MKNLEEFTKWIKEQSFLTVFITSWMIVNWDIVIYLLFNKEKLHFIYHIMSIDKNNPYFFSDLNRFDWLAIYDITLPLLLTWIRMKFVKNISIRLEKISDAEEKRVAGEIDKLNKEIKEKNLQIQDLESEIEKCRHKEKEIVFIIKHSFHDLNYSLEKISNIIEHHSLEILNFLQYKHILQKICSILDDEDLKTTEETQRKTFFEKI